MSDQHPGDHAWTTREDAARGAARLLGALPDLLVGVSAWGTAPAVYWAIEPYWWPHRDGPEHGPERLPIALACDHQVSHYIDHYLEEDDA